MSRRVLFLIAVLSLALLGLAVAPWPLSPGGFASAVGEHLEEDYGLSFAVRGRRTIALLPMPRVKFEDVAVGSADGRVSAEGGILRGQLALGPLLLGRVELTDVSLAGSRITLAPERLGEHVAGALRSAESGRRSLQVRRLRLLDAHVQVASQAVEHVTLSAHWPLPSEPLVVEGHGTWRGERVTVTRVAVEPLKLAAGQLSPFAAAAEAAGARFSVVGEILPGEGVRMTGHSIVQASSVRDLSRWAGVDLPLGALIGRASIVGDFTADRRRISWPSVAVTIGADALEGALALRFEGERPAVTGTLAADSLNLADFLAPFGHARTASGLWSGEEASLSRAAGGDLDVRVSAGRAQAGRLRLRDMAASVMVRPGRIEASIGRATLNGGAVKGRAVFVAIPEGGMDVKLQGAFEAVELGALLSDLYQPRWISGRAAGQFTLEGAGATPADIVRQSHGRSLVQVKGGELHGIGLGEALRRLEKRPLSAFLDGRGGRTPFDLAHVHLNVGAGLGEIMDGALAAPSLRASLRGRVSLIDRDVAVKALVDAAPGAGPEPPIVLDVLGPWDDISVVPDVRALIERSGAAKPLFAAPAMRDAAAQ